jgi:hypothetical protein
VDEAGGELKAQQYKKIPQEIFRRDFYCSVKIYFTILNCFVITASSVR